ncbi:hypothetical protein ANN_27144 [Periplaneta americana]|uniref:Uncharacterized protein n=1 Tax=Periplaneta americana TaxID=6978 RepID=A0ABQ8RXS2_PERAM|nr:hypothetical protein ANN_27144 [Periplaneta americana]
MAGLCEGGNEPPGSLKANMLRKHCRETHPDMVRVVDDVGVKRGAPECGARTSRPTWMQSDPLPRSPVLDAPRWSPENKRPCRVCTDRAAPQIADIIIINKMWHPSVSSLVIISAPKALVGNIETMGLLSLDREAHRSREPWDRYPSVLNEWIAYFEREKHESRGLAGVHNWNVLVRTQHPEREMERVTPLLPVETLAKKVAVCRVATVRKTWSSDLSVFHTVTQIRGPQCEVRTPPLCLKFPYKTPSPTPAARPLDVNYATDECLRIKCVLIPGLPARGLAPRDAWVEVERRTEAQEGSEDVEVTPGHSPCAEF